MPLLSIGSKTCRAGVAEVKGFVLEIRRFHLDGQMIDAKAIMQFGS